MRLVVTIAPQATLGQLRSARPRRPAVQEGGLGTSASRRDAHDPQLTYGPDGACRRPLRARLRTHRVGQRAPVGTGRSGAWGHCEPAGERRPPRTRTWRERVRVSPGLSNPPRFDIGEPDRRLPRAGIALAPLGAPRGGSPSRQWLRWRLRRERERMAAQACGLTHPSPIDALPRAMRGDLAARPGRLSCAGTCALLPTSGVYFDKFRFSPSGPAERTARRGHSRRASPSWLRRRAAAAWSPPSRWNRTADGRPQGPRRDHVQVEEREAGAVAVETCRPRVARSSRRRGLESARCTVGLIARINRGGRNGPRGATGSGRRGSPDD
jgi:hypothetical protein